MSSPPRCIFVTVGSTHFDELVEAVLAPKVLQALRQRGFSKLVVQTGKYEIPDIGQRDGEWHWESEGLMIEAWRYKEGISRAVDEADWVISHAGSGTMLDVLRRSKPLIVVPNSSLLDDHQTDLALALSSQNYLVSSTVDSLAETIKTFIPTALAPFPPHEPTRFATILDEEMGFL